MVNLNASNFLQELNHFLQNNGKTHLDYARALKCSRHTVERLILQKTYPTDENLKQTMALMCIGFDDYNKLSDKDKERISETVGTAVGGVTGMMTISSVVSALGTTIGLSAPGISSGLTALGGVIGGGMVAGITVASAIPLAGLGVGYGVVRGIKWFFKNEKYLDGYEDNIDEKWERF